MIAVDDGALGPAVAAGTFDLELFQLLTVLEIEVAPVRENRDVLRHLVEYILRTHGESRAYDRVLMPNAREKLEAHELRGNILELENVLCRARELAGGGVIEEKHISFKGQPAHPQRRKTKTGPYAGRRGRPPAPPIAPEIFDDIKKRKSAGEHLTVLYRMYRHEPGGPRSYHTLRRRLDEAT